MALGFGSCAHAQERSFNVAADYAARSIPAFARQAGLQILAPADELARIRTPPIYGVIDTRAALRTLLTETGLVIVADYGATIVLRHAEPARRRQSGAVREPRPANGYDGSTISRSPDPDDSASVQLESVVVTGTRLDAMSSTAPTPVTMLTAEAIQRRAPGSIADAVNELPAFRATLSPSTTTRGVTGNAVQQADLRGLGVARTLTLINGRRLPPANNLFAADMGQIPISLVDRVEVVTGGASAAYGSDAVAGVLNFVLDIKLNGLKGGVQLGSSEYGDQRETVLNLGYGAQIGERLHVLIGGDFARDKGAGNFYARDIFRAEPGLVGRISDTSPAQSFADGVEAIYTPGGIISGGPLNGVAFTLSGAPYAFNYGSVVGNNQIGATSNYGFSPLLVVQLRHPSERRNMMLAADFYITGQLQFFTEINSAFNTSAGGYGDTLQANFAINSTNPFIPAAVRSELAARGLNSFNLGRFNSDISSYISAQEYRTRRAMLGVRGRTDLFGVNWNWEAYGQLGRTRADTRYERMIDMPNLLAAINVVSDANGVPVCAPAATNPNLSAAQQGQAEADCVPFNVFGQTNTAAAIEYVTGTVAGQTRIDQDVTAVSFNGSPFRLPAGDVALAFGAEFRRETIVAISDPRSKIGAWQELSQSSFANSNSVREIYAELGAPILRQTRLAKSLDLNAAIRRTDYRITGAVTTWKLGATWEPTDFLRLRATQSRDVRAPNLTELSLQGLITGQGNFFNPFLQQSELRTAIQVTGNGNLVPEIADSFTAGVAFLPRWRVTQGLRISVDYYRIGVRRVIGALSFTDTIQRCFNGDQPLCDLITFDGARRITLVKTPQVNFAGLETEGLDIELSYRLPAGALPFDLPGALNIRNLATVVSKNSRRDGVVTVSRNGFSNGGSAKLMGNATADYTLGRFTGGLQARYFGDVRWDPAMVGPDSPFYAPSLSNSISRNLFPGQVIFNANAGFVFNNEGRSVQVFAVVNNLFDRAPSIQGAIAFNQNGIQYYDLIGRLYRAGVRVRF